MGEVEQPHPAPPHTGERNQAGGEYGDFYSMDGENSPTGHHHPGTSQSLIGLEPVDRFRAHAADSANIFVFNKVGE